MRYSSWLLVSVMLGIVSPSGVSCADPVRYEQDLKPIFRERCAYCHGGLKQEAGLRMDTGELIRKGGESGASVQLGQPEASLLLARITESDESLRMPPEGGPLKPEQIDLIRRWIAEGATSPANEQPEEDPRAHWAFQPIRHHEVPQVDLQKWGGHPIDAFIGQRMEQKGLQPNPTADKPTLLRRVTIDLIGVPPTREELQRFLTDESPEAYERVVDRLLASPQYGERWGRHWMDVWRYSDWYGRRSVPDVMNSYPQIWRWRDWIVRSLNEDKGYDRMAMEMIAADEICPTADENLVATGFIVRNWFKWNYNSWMKDQVEHTSKAFLGLTMNCCQCHDHKYDPLTQEDYFRFRAFFEPLELRHDRTPGETDPGPFKKYVYAASYGPITSGMVRVFDEKPDSLTYMYAKGDERNLIKDKPPFEAGVPAILNHIPFQVEKITLPAEAYYPGLKNFVREEELAKIQSSLAEAEERSRTADTKWQELRKGLQAQCEATREKLVPPKLCSPDAPAAGLVLQGKQSLHLVSQGGRRVLANGLSSIADLQTIRELSCHVRLVKEGAFNLQLAGEFKSGRTAAWISFQQGKLVTYDKDYREIQIGEYPVAQFPLDFEFVLTLNQSAGICRVEVRQKGAETRTLASAETPLGGWGKGTRTEQGLWIDIREGAEVVLDDLQVRYNEKDSLTFDFEGQSWPEIAETVIAREGWVNSGYSAGKSEISISSLLEYDGQAKESLRAYQIARIQSELADLEHRVAEADLANQRSLLFSMRKRILADDVVYRRTGGDPLVAGREAASAEQGANFAAAQLTLLQAEREILKAELTQLQPKGEGVASTNDALLKAMNQCEEAKRSLVSIQGKELQATYSPLSPRYPTQSSGRRAAFVKWLTHRDNPLTARVAVNHIWLRHFGRGLVETTFDFGRRGKLPSHPELLDWLARELQDHQWSMKHLHRLMVTSKTYQRTSRPGDSEIAARSLDEENRLYWRFNSYRVQAEVVRDSILSTSGLLDHRLGGQEIDQSLGLDVPRKSLYFSHHGETVMPFLSLFDSANPVDCYERRSSVQPQQALAQANSQLTIGAARLMAKPIWEDLKSRGLSPEDVRSELVSTLFERILSRKPLEQEARIAVEFLEQQKELFREKSIVGPTENVQPLNSGATSEPRNQESNKTPVGLGLDKLDPASDPELRGVENLIHALFNHNDFFVVR